MTSTPVIEAASLPTAFDPRTQDAHRSFSYLSGNAYRPARYERSGPGAGVRDLVGPHQAVGGSSAYLPAVTRPWARRRAAPNDRRAVHPSSDQRPGRNGKWHG